MITIEEKARRVMATIEATRKQAREAGVDGADAIGADAYDVAAHVLRPSDSSELRRVRATLAEIRVALGKAAASIAILDRAEIAERQGCFCHPTGPGLAMQCGGSGEYDPVCTCSCHAFPVDQADPRQLVVPGSIEETRLGAPLAFGNCAVHPYNKCACSENNPPNMETAKPDAPKAIRSRAEEQEIPIQDWKPEKIFLSSLQTAMEDTAAVERHLERFRIEHTGKVRQRWASVFRSWLDRERRKPTAATPLTSPAATE